MPVAKRLRVALQSLATNKMRSAMIVLTLSLSTVLLLLTISLKAGVEDRVFALMDLFFHPNEGGISYPDLKERAGVASLSYSARLQDLRLLQTRLGEEASFAGEIQGDAMVSRAGRHLSLFITAAEPSFLEIKGLAIQRGSALDQEDERSLNRVCILTEDVAADLFGTELGIGAEIQIAGAPFHVKGVRAANESVAKLSPKAARQVLIPFGTGMRRLWNYEGPEIIQFKVKEPFQLQKVVGEITALLRKEHHVVPPHQDDFKIYTGENLAKNYRAGKRALIMAAFGLSLLALFIGAGVAANTMIASLAQRASEFALKRALGAQHADLSLEVILESLIMSMAAFTLGCFVSCCLLVIWHCCASPMTIKRFPVDLTFYAFILPACLEVVIGLSCGAVVARHLSQMDTAKALRG